MSIESLMQAQTEAINANTAMLAKLLENGAFARPEKQQPVTTTTNDVEKNVTNETSEDNGNKVALRKTYVFFKDTKTGQVVAKGEEVPTDNGAVNVKQTKWNELCEKYSLNPETGEAVEEETDEVVEEEIDTEEMSDGLGLDDEDLGLDDDEPTHSAEDVRLKLVAVAKEKGRDAALKIMKKVDASNFNDVKPEHYNSVFAEAEAALKG